MSDWRENVIRELSPWLLSEGPLSPYAGHVDASPIENALELTMSLYAGVGATWLRLERSGEPRDQCILMQRQIKIEQYTADFVFSVTDHELRTHRLVVECDGHNYHERTKEQAAHDRSRDRRMQELGYTVFRFTGSEIHQHAWGCCRQIMKWAENASFIGWKKNG